MVIHDYNQEKALAELESRMFEGKEDNQRGLLKEGRVWCKLDVNINNTAFMFL